MNDPYRIKRPFFDLKSLLESDAKAAIDCQPCASRNPCPKRLKAEPPKPEPIPSKPIPWECFLLILAFFFGASGLLYKAYERKMKSYFILNSKNDCLPRKFVRQPLKVQKLPTKTQYLIIGAGTAGVAAYNAITEHDKKAKILFMSDEDIMPYDKPHLSKGLWRSPELILEKLSFMEGKKELSCLYFDPSKFVDCEKFSELEEGPAVTIAMGWPISRVEADQHKAYTFSNFEETAIEYKKCLIATGSSAIDLRFLQNMDDEVKERTCRLRTIRDLEAALLKVPGAQDVVIVGDGSLALELAYSVKHASEYIEIKNDLNVTLVIPRAGVFSSIVPDYLAQWAAEKVKAEGIQVIKESEVLDCYLTKKSETEKTLTVFLSSGQEISADFIFLSLGAVPRTELAKPSLLEVDKERGGFLVNTELMARTDLYVAGDCASLYDLHNNRIRYEHHNSAVETGCVAGQNMTGDMKPFTTPSSYTVKFGKHILLKSFGETNSKFDSVGVFTTCVVETMQETDKRPPQPKGEEPCFKRTDEYKKKFQKGVVFYLRDDVIIGLVLWNLEGKDEIALEILSKKPKQEDIKALVKQLEIHKENCCSEC